MLWKRTYAEILLDWHETLDFAIEAGETPIFNMGISHNLLDGITSWHAAQAIMQSPQIVFTPALFAVGGNSALWLMTLFDKPTPPASGQVSPTTYTGVDPATHMACLATFSTFADRTLSPKREFTGMSIAVRWLLFPQLEPAVISSWQAIPLTMILKKESGLYGRSASSTYPPNTNSNQIDIGPVSDLTSHQVKSTLDINTDDSLQDETWQSLITLALCALIILAALIQ